MKPQTHRLFCIIFLFVGLFGNTSLLRASLCSEAFLNGPAYHWDRAVRKGLTFLDEASVIGAMEYREHVLLATSVQSIAKAKGGVLQGSPMDRQFGANHFYKENFPGLQVHRGTGNDVRNAAGTSITLSGYGMEAAFRSAIEPDFSSWLVHDPVFLSRAREEVEDWDVFGTSDGIEHGTEIIKGVIAKP